MLNKKLGFYAGKGAIISQFRVWPFPSASIMTFGERNRNPDHLFAGVNMIQFIYIKILNQIKWLC